MSAPSAGLRRIIAAGSPYATAGRAVAALRAAASVDANEAASALQHYAAWGCADTVAEMLRLLPARGVPLGPRVAGAGVAAASWSAQGRRRHLAASAQVWTEACGAAPLAAALVGRWMPDARRGAKAYAAAAVNATTTQGWGCCAEAEAAREAALRGLVQHGLAPSAEVLTLLLACGPPDPEVFLDGAAFASEDAKKRALGREEVPVVVPPLGRYNAELWCAVRWGGRDPRSVTDEMRLQGVRPNAKTVELLLQRRHDVAGAEGSRSELGDLADVLAYACENNVGRTTPDGLLYLASVVCAAYEKGWVEAGGGGGGAAAAVSPLVSPADVGLIHAVREVGGGGGGGGAPCAIDTPARLAMLDALEGMLDAAVAAGLPVHPCVFDALLRLHTVRGDAAAVDGVAGVMSAQGFELEDSEAAVASARSAVEEGVVSGEGGGAGSGGKGGVCLMDRSLFPLSHASLPMYNLLATTTEGAEAGVV